MVISLIVAMDEQRGIGKGDRLPWRLSADLQRFKALTMGHYVIMGRKTWESIRRQLPGRTMVVITHQANYTALGCRIVLSLEAALEMAQQSGESEAFVIGGGELFAQALPLADRVYLTQVHSMTEADTFFPALEDGGWVEIETQEHPKDDTNQFPFTFRVLERREG